MRKYKIYDDTPYMHTYLGKSYQISPVSYFEIVEGIEGKKKLKIPTNIVSPKPRADKPKSLEQYKWLTDLILDRGLKIEKRVGCLEWTILDEESLNILLAEIEKLGVVDTHSELLADIVLENKINILFRKSLPIDLAGQITDVVEFAFFVNNGKLFANIEQIGGPHSAFTPKSVFQEKWMEKTFDNLYAGETYDKSGIFYEIKRRDILIKYLDAVKELSEYDEGEEWVY